MIANIFKFNSPLPLLNLLESNPTKIQEIVLDAIKNPKTSTKDLKNICQKLDPSNLHLLLKKAVKQEMDKESPLAAFSRLTQALSLEQIEAALKTEYPTLESALEKAKELAVYAKHYIESQPSSFSQPAVAGMIQRAIWAIDNFIDTMFSAFGIYELGKDIDNPFEAQYRLQSLTAVISIFASFIAIVASFTQNVVVTTAMTGASLILAGICIHLYLRYVKPVPRSIIGCRNLTEEALTDTSSIIHERFDCYDEIANQLLANNRKPKRHPLIIGETGVGKTEIFKGFARAALAGRYPALADKQFFYVNTAELVNSGGGFFDSSPTIERIKERTKYHSDKIVIILDEIQEACRGGRRNNLGNRLKTRLDPSQGGFAYVIAATTPDEYFRYVRWDKALARRFKQIPVKSMNEDETLSLLNKIVLSHPGVSVAPGTIEAIYALTKKHFPDAPQPYYASYILAQVIGRSENASVINHLKNSLKAEEAKLHKNLSSRLATVGKDFILTTQKENKDIQKKIKELKDQLKAEEEREKKRQRMLNELNQSKKDILKLANQIETAPKTSQAKLEPLLKELIVTSHYVHIAWEEVLQEYDKTTNQSSIRTINEDLVKTIIDEEIERQKEVEKQSANIEKEQTSLRDRVYALVKEILSEANNSGELDTQ